MLLVSLLLEFGKNKIIMAIKTALLIGTPSLREVSSPITPEDFGSAWLLELIQDLHDSQEHYGGVGIAAPQIGVIDELFYLALSIPNATKCRSGT